MSFEPCGSYDLRSWSSISNQAGIGELIFDGTLSRVLELSLPLKLLFKKQGLSTQIHSGDALVPPMGVACGKTEEWHRLLLTDAYSTLQPYLLCDLNENATTPEGVDRETSIAIPFRSMEGRP